MKAIDFPGPKAHVMQGESPTESNICVQSKSISISAAAIDYHRLRFVKSFHLSSSVVSKASTLLHPHPSMIIPNRSARQVRRPKTQTKSDAINCPSANALGKGWEQQQSRCHDVRNHVGSVRTNIMIKIEQATQQKIPGPPAVKHG